MAALFLQKAIDKQHMAALSSSCRFAVFGKWRTNESTSCVCFYGQLLSTICHKSHQEISHVICKIQGRQTYLLPGSNEALDTAVCVWIMPGSECV